MNEQYAVIQNNTKKKKHKLVGNSVTKMQKSGSEKKTPQNLLIMH